MAATANNLEIAAHDARGFFDGIRRILGGFELFFPYLIRPLVHLKAEEPRPAHMHDFRVCVLRVGLCWPEVFVLHQERRSRLRNGGPQGMARLKHGVWVGGRGHHPLCGVPNERFIRYSISAPLLGHVRDNVPSVASAYYR